MEVYFELAIRIIYILYSTVCVGHKYCLDFITVDSQRIYIWELCIIDGISHVVAMPPGCTIRGMYVEQLEVNAASPVFAVCSLRLSSSDLHSRDLG